MDIKILQAYIQNCKKANISPTLDGLKNYKLQHKKITVQESKGKNTTK
jgi:hypothetical protein